MRLNFSNNEASPKISHLLWWLHYQLVSFVKHLVSIGHWFLASHARYKLGKQYETAQWFRLFYISATKAMCCLNKAFALKQRLRSESLLSGEHVRSLLYYARTQNGLQFGLPLRETNIKQHWILCAIFACIAHTCISPHSRWCNPEQLNLQQP